MQPRRPSFLEALLLVVGLVLTVQYAWLMDDAFVYFRYADNLLFARRGLVYNAGEFVEGYSSPLWMVLLAAVRGLGLDWWLAVRLLGGLTFVAFWGLLVRLGRELAPRGVAPVHLPLLLSVPNYAVLCYFTSGLEAPLVQVLAAAFAMAAVRPDLRWLQVVVGLAPVVRHELLLPLVLHTAWCLWRTRRIPWPLLASLTASLGGWLIFRVWYYADLLPNTFYLKDEWLPWQGLAYVSDTLRTYYLQVVFGLALIGFLVLWGRDRRARRQGIGRPPLHLAARAVMLCMALGVTAYVVKIGGDPRHYRYLAFPVCLAVAATAGLPEQLLFRSRRGLPRLVVIGLAGLLMVGVALLYPRQIDRHPLLGPRPGQPLTPNHVGNSGRVPFHHTVDLINDAAVHRHHPDLACPPWGACPRIDLREAYRAAAVVGDAPPHEGVFVGYWCATIYGKPRERVVHSLGLTDPFLARTRMRSDRPAHKYGLVPIARDLRMLLLANGNRPHVGMFREAVRNGSAPRWALGNLETLAILERKAYNRHDRLENTRLAVFFPAKIDPLRPPTP